MSRRPHGTRSQFFPSRDDLPRRTTWARATPARRRAATSKRRSRAMQNVVRREFINGAGAVTAIAVITPFATTLAQAQISGGSNMATSRTSSFTDALHAERPAADRTDKMGLYGWLVGRWEVDAVYHLDGEAQRRARGEIHASWVLEGRALQ